MITRIDAEGNERQVENAKLEKQIQDKWEGLNVSNIVIDDEFGTISAAVETKGKSVYCGNLDENGNLESDEPHWAANANFN